LFACLYQIYFISSEKNEPSTASRKFSETKLTLKQILLKLGYDSSSYIFFILFRSEILTYFLKKKWLEIFADFQWKRKGRGKSGDTRRWKKFKHDFF